MRKAAYESRLIDWLELYKHKLFVRVRSELDIEENIHVLYGIQIIISIERSHKT